MEPRLLEIKSFRGKQMLLFANCGGELMMLLAFHSLNHIKFKYPACPAPVALSDGAVDFTQRFTGVQPRGSGHQVSCERCVASVVCSPSDVSSAVKQSTEKCQDTFLHTPWDFRGGSLSPRRPALNISSLCSCFVFSSITCAPSHLALSL